MVYINYLNKEIFVRGESCEKEIVVVIKIQMSKVEEKWISVEYYVAVV